ncbi:LacI family DNA-binding transcriptional regulator [Dactylosporangium sp. CS-033363]|uniref:LacI family DNA-binding transcriptional regulator n=1 Tax=Dactylosporangium sp. CS-033363 TaxID=3239935 RepID=UPI003D922D96
MHTVRRPPAMRDVAHLAGVSHQTVSRVVNDHPNVRSETRARVLAAMRALDYQPNVAARTLATNRSQTVGLVTFDTTLFGPSFMVHAIERAAREAGYFVSIASAREPDVPQVRDAIRRLREQAVEGIVTLAPVAAAWTALRQEPLDVPIVGLGIVGPDGDGAGVPMVAIDNAAGAALATRHLLALGHATVHHVAGPANWPEARERQAGWRTALEDAGRTAPAVLAGDWSAAAGHGAGLALAGMPEVTAVFCANDQMAIGVLRALHEAGRPVPSDVSVVGFDDVPEAPYLLPPLTTVRQDFAELGRHSLALLVDQISTGSRGGEQFRSAPSLIVRSSTATPLAY